MFSFRSKKSSYEKMKTLGIDIPVPSEDFVVGIQQQLLDMEDGIMSGSTGYLVFCATRRQGTRNGQRWTVKVVKLFNKEMIFHSPNVNLKMGCLRFFLQLNPIRGLETKVRRL